MLAGNQGFEIASSNEVIYAYLGTTANAPTSFLTAITNGNFANAGQITNTGLQEGLNALDLNGGASTTPDYAAYLGPRSGLNQFAEYKALVADRSNWTVDAVNGDYSNVAHDTTAFTISSVPNPPSVWLFSTALIALAGICRRQLSPCKVDKSIKAARNA